MVVEYFNEEEHLRYVVEQGAERQLTDADVSFIWLDCDLDTVLSRKLDEHPKDFLKQQYSRKNHRYKHKGEIEIITSDKSLDEVARDILSNLDLAEARPVT